MISPDHVCWWTAHRTTQLTRQGRSLIGAGICLPALEYAAVLLNTSIATAGSSTDEFGLTVTIGGDRGSLHDDCMFSFESVRPAFISALVRGMLEHHAAYLGCDHMPRALHEHICSKLAVDSTVRVTARPRQQTVAVKAYPVHSSFFRRWTTASTVFHPRSLIRRL